MDFLQLAQDFELPLYVYDGEKIVEKINQLREAFADLPLKIKYAVKALSNISILKLIKSQGVGADVVSIQEAHIAIKAGFLPDEILFTPNGVSFEEIQQAVELGIHINIDNLSTLERFGNEYKNSVACCIRINPHILAGGNSKIQVGHIDSKFGISVLQMRHVLRIVEHYNINVSGLHMHTGSDILDASAFLRGAEILFENAMLFKNLKFLDFGSGFKVAYKKDDIVTDLTDLGQKLTLAYQDFCKNYGKNLEIWFEPGKYIVSESGYFLVKTNVIKQTPANIFVAVDSGLNHLIRPMFYDAYHQIINVSNPDAPLRIYNVVGYICETDTFGIDRQINEVREGDILVFKNAGAYGFMMSSNYNSRFRPAEVLVYKEKTHLIRQRETMEDILKNQILVKDF